MMIMRMYDDVGVGRCMWKKYVGRMERSGGRGFK